MAYVTPSELDRLRGLLRAQDQRAQELGVMTLAWYEQVRRLALEVLRGEQEQRRAGEETLAAHGFDPATADLTIDLASGLIQKLVAGRWDLAE